MLNILHTKINNIVPIIGIQEIEENNFIIQYSNHSEVSEQQQIIIDSILQSWPLDKMKIIKQRQLDNYWNEQIDKGFVTEARLRLGLTSSDVSLLTGLFLLSKESGTDNVHVVDMEGVSHTMSTDNFTTLMLQYGQHRSDLSLYYSQKKKLIEESNSIEQLNSIII